MPTYEYKGLSAKGKPVSGHLDADGPADLRARLVKDGTFLTQFAEARTGGASLKDASGKKGAARGMFSRDIDLKSMFERVRPQDVAILTRQFGTLLKAGIPMTDALTALSAQQDRPKLKVVIGRVREKVREGTSLADALAEHKAVFPDRTSTWCAWARRRARWTSSWRDWPTSCSNTALTPQCQRGARSSPSNNFTSYRSAPMA